MSRRSRAPRRALLAGFLLHSLALAWIAATTSPAARGTLLVWIDLPLSLAYLGATGFLLLALSFVVGGLWWGAIAAGLAALLGRLVDRR